MKAIRNPNLTALGLKRIKKISYLIALTFLVVCHSSNAEPYDDFSEVSATYIGLCYGMEYLKSKKCPQFSITLPNKCIDNVTTLVPSTNSVQFARALLEVKSQLKTNAINGIEVGFAKTLALTKGDIEKACIGYGSSLATMSHMKYEEVKRLSKWLK
jgi:hypothetical protein